MGTDFLPVYALIAEVCKAANVGVAVTTGIWQKGRDGQKVG